MLLRLALLAAVLGGALVALRSWRRAPRRLADGVDLPHLGVTGPAIVQFTAPGCAVCHRSRPGLEEAAGHAGIGFAQVDTSERPDAADRYGIRSVPTVVVVDRRGGVTGAWTGLPPPEELVGAAARAGG